ncbi:Major Facilitator Superfamily protein [Lentzea waywayandensis]|uniref:Major Facilitator Superfamily protein n=1 Tax=Lentzea waywayandensis TaxID=84724 RepID=A0A1I6FFS4_9PSEU|nr:MFS transporter [Lentzea waywayandensis]SFR28796.1 Major Facilitator Superfamily protein [Lentzea waywayandensis]
MVSVAPAEQKTLRRLMAAGLVGSSLEWYDFFIYATAAALVFPKLFFPEATPIVALLLSFSTFWAGFVARPLGGLVFGHVGDKAGRKPALVICLGLMAAATFLIGLLPTTASIGVGAPLLLVLLRFLQGIAVGGQWGGVVLLLTETAGPRKRGFAGTFGQAGVPIGVLLGNVAFISATTSLSPEAFASWGWRVPFLASALLFPVVLFIQLKVEDSPVFRELKERRATEPAVAPAPLKEVLRTHRKPILLGAGLMFASNAIFYVSIAGVLSYATTTLGLARESVLIVSLLSSIVSIPVILWAGHASDRLGRRPLIIAGTIGMIVWAFPYFLLVDTGSLVLMFVASTVGGIASSLVYGPIAAYLGELFEPHVRYSGASLAYQLASILVSGGTPFVMTALLGATGTSMSVSAFLLVMGLCTLVSVIKLPETHQPERA